MLKRRNLHEFKNSLALPWEVSLENTDSSRTIELPSLGSKKGFPLFF